MASKPDLRQWIPAEDYARQAAFAPSEIVSFILDGALEGQRVGNRWYVSHPLVCLELPDPNDLESAVLKCSVCKIGEYVTAGRGELVIPVRLNDPGVATARATLESAMQKRVELPVCLHLNGERFAFDSSLWFDLCAALVEFAALNDPFIEEPDASGT